jgi:hypothetical protein
VLDRRINLREGSEIGTDSGATMALRSELWILDEGVDILQRFSDGPIASAPAVFTHSIGSGSWCTVAGYMDPKGLQKLLVGFLDG